MVRWPATQPDFPHAKHNRDSDAVAHSANASNEGWRAVREQAVSAWRAEAEEGSPCGVVASCNEYAEGDDKNE